MKFEVVFWFDNENLRTAKVIAESEKALIKELQECEHWYEFEDGKRIANVNMRLVTQFDVKENKKASLGVLFYLGSCAMQVHM